MRPLDPAGGVVERFACELRALRAPAGEPPFWKMARRCEVSKSALAAAVAGYELPSERVVRAFVLVCRGDGQWWSQRLAQARAQLQAGPVTAAGGLPQRTAGAELALVRHTPLVRHAPPIAAMARAPLPAPTAFLPARPATGPKPHTRAPRRLVAPALAAVAALLAAALAVALLRGHPATSAPPPLLGAYDQTVGPGCPDTALARVTQDDFTETHKWTQATAAHWNVPGCSDLLVYSQPTASSDPARWQDDYEWYFDNVPKTAQCTFHIYVPDSPDAAYTAAYDWTTGDTSYLESTAFVIDQTAYRGQWYSHGPYTFPTGQAMMMVTDARGTTPNTPLAAAAVRLTCK